MGEQSQPGGRFVIDWVKSFAVDHSSFTPRPSNSSRPSHGLDGDDDDDDDDPGLDVSYNMQYSCCGKSAFTKAGRRVLLHAGVQNAGSNPRENAFSLARDIHFDGGGNLRQAFVPELAILRGRRHTAPQRYTVSAGATLPVPPAGNQLEIKVRRVISDHAHHNSSADTRGSRGSAAPGSWGIIVFGSSDLTLGTKIGFDERHFFVDR